MDRFFGFAFFVLLFFFLLFAFLFLFLFFFGSVFLRINFVEADLRLFAGSANGAGLLD